MGKEIKILFYCSLVITIFTGNQGFVNGQNAPVSTISNVSTYSNSAILTLTATGFNNIGAVDLKIMYDPSIALATSVTAGSTLPGNIVYNVLIPGEIIIGWYNVPAVTMPGGAIIFNLFFVSSGYGYSDVEFDDTNGYNCRWYDSNSAVMNDLPTNSYYINGSVNFKDPYAPNVFLPDTTACSNSLVTIPVRVSDFNDIGKFNLTLQYNSNVLGFQSFNNVSGFPGLTVALQGSGSLGISGTISGGNTGYTLPDSSILVLLTFYHSYGNSSLSWYDGGTSCAWYGPPPVYFALTDIPQTSYYFNGNLNGLALPSPAGPVNGPAGGVVCHGDDQINFSISPVTSASYYLWTLPDGFSIVSGDSTNNVIVSATSGAVSGAVTVSGVNSCGAGTPSLPFPVVPADPPSITSQPQTPPAVIAGVGSASFTVGASGDSLQFQWQELNANWNNIMDGGVYSGTGSAVLTISQPPLTMNGRHYRCRVNGYCPPDTVTDGQAKLIVGPYEGIGQTDFFNTIKIFPNPVTEKTGIHIPDIDCNSIRLTIYDIAGKEIDSFMVRMDNGSELFISFPFKDLTKGVYILSVQVNKNDIVLNWIKNILVLIR